MSYKLDRDLSIARLQDELEGVAEKYHAIAQRANTPEPWQRKLKVTIYARI
ncbi:hypothetical protein [Comamonas terrigena]|uniref:hypothetical protein n=1 Tax=Comamonas terrigena TaxID=32013 RepID=UPI002446EF85|nr:hypothetical protein [Comamonas terrigena]MDH1701345.1 hypothetical protein [Comamonas terrigena]